ncbi:FadR/GntR family transcriptional regulator [Hoeflea prorocentri]|uniref:Pyruvate dehydrogenase complex repressor n=1 Tax=Hoeflea prorocentri TaxID=1922333 RepID=A0A9X3UK76_9HYPH|nr:FadR/GntR family transcriptional regulator [Hoeflea prorocentri]MCY6382330.1 FadR/GntR family transcriptional regulator [Hoeflea prorocentri]MDA5400130.1 FadR/GntR family transcriptional regulator [Hoeflea prorocentri]
MDDIFTRVAHGRTADEVVQQVESLILDGVLRVGDRLPGERELSRQLDISRPILREALKTLEQRGLLTSRHGGGTFIADVIGEIFSQPVMELIARHRRATFDYLEYRREVEGITAAFAAQRATQADRELLAGIVQAMKQAHDAADPDREAELDVEFHSAIGEAAHNIILLHTLRSCYRLLSNGVFYNRAAIYQYSGSSERLLEQHIAIFDAIVAGDADGAKGAAERHMEFVAHTLREAERANDWARVANLRLQQRAKGGHSDDSKRKTATKRA